MLYFVYRQTVPNEAGETHMAEADSRLIEWLFHESGITRYKISKDIGISESTLSRIANGETPMDAVRFGYARKLTNYARSVQSSQDEDASDSVHKKEQSDAESPSKGGDDT
jgi:transcriptional regulator with XRE-family HTH domain